jgi:Iron-containing alcohol dehydrogenase
MCIKCDFILNTVQPSNRNISTKRTSTSTSTCPPVFSQRSNIAFTLLFGTGGGSALDLGKAVAALMTNTGDVFEYLEIIGKGMPIEKLPMPHIAVPTTSGTGSECTKNAVLKSLSHGRKASMRHDSMLPTIAIIDPCLSVSCPQQVRSPPSHIPYPLSSHHIPQYFTPRRMQGGEKSDLQSFGSSCFDALILLTYVSISKRISSLSSP